MTTAVRPVNGWKLARALNGETIDLPVTEFIPPQTWVTSEFKASPVVHLIDRAIAAWTNDTPRFGVLALCGNPVLCPQFHHEAPDGELCDGCLLADFVPPILVYRFFDADDRLLYVGCTVNLLQRIYAHKKSSTAKDWWPLVVRVECVEFETQEAALAAELAAIRTEGPLFNRSSQATAPRARRPPGARVSRR